ncbi:putative 3-hydroxyanthranilate 3,4-dioxygenase [Dictyocaulus viviparus]|uniref:Putative 3-hydroxyanthranilate 3,4-dioxygenase n=1 Tax=Dictyocaulus viviparus TaxID=29172 RepID=A0A0D8Y408_DICVI|nr:putative 3-hydroxyanthranilate 3,4-dioxygenase [Dictyocaulus viviparus]
MILKVIERGQPRDIIIKEGEIFLLPSRVEHSPQRYANTIGFVLERTRENTEFDCVRYFVDSTTTQRLFERWFHLNDVVRDLPPLIQAFHSSEEFKSGIPGPKSFLVNAPYEAVARNLSKPINLYDFIQQHKEKLRNGPVEIYGAPDYSTNVFLYGQGRYSMQTDEFELLIWIMEDSRAILESSTVGRLCEAMTMTLCPPNSK